MMDADINPAMLRLARQSRGLTMAQLAALARVSSPTVSRCESGTLVVAEPALHRIGDALDYPSTFFRRWPALIGLVGGSLFHRKPHLLPVVQLYQAHALAEVRRLEATALLRSLDDAGQSLPEYPVELFEDDPEAIARSVRVVMNLPPGPIFNLTETLEQSGCVVVSHAGQSRQFAGFGQRPPYPPCFIHVSSELPPDGWRWTLAHELGHMVMHFEPMASPKLVEEQADRFAAEFLCPGHELRRMLEDLSFQKLGGLKREWGVSMQALINRAHQLQTISASQKRSLLARLYQAGYRTREPETLDPPVERPQRMRALAAAHLDQLGYTRPELLDLLTLREADFRRHYAPGDDILEQLGLDGLLNP